MDPDGDYESRHSTRSTANDGIDLDVADVALPSKIFAPDDNTKPPAKTMNGQEAYEGPTAPPMEAASLAAAAATSNRSAVEPRGTAYDDMMSGKTDITVPGEAPIRNSVAVPIGFDSDDMALPEAKALPIVGSTANEGTTMPSATLDEVEIEDTEAQIPVPVPPSPDGDANSNTPSNVEQEEKETATTSRCTRKRKWCCFGIVVLGIVLGVLFGTRKGQWVLRGYPQCDGEWPHNFADGQCSKELNNAACGWDGGDCDLYNSYPDCDVDYPDAIGDFYTCSGGEYNTAECGWDGGDCDSENAILWQTYPDCKGGVYPPNIGNGICDVYDGGQHNTADCGWDGGDCLVDGYPDCHVDYPLRIGDGVCHGDDYNTAECGWDGGDCPPRTGGGQGNIGDATIQNNGGGGSDDEDEEDKEEGNGGDDGVLNNPNNINNAEPTPTEEPTDEGSYDATGAGTPLNYPNCFLEWPEYVGDGHCDAGLDPFWYGLYNVEECGWDGGDCDEENAILWKTYPECKGGVDPEAVGDGHCDGARYNTAECGWDGGDCFLENYPNCKTNNWEPNLEWIADGFCNGGRYDTAQCGWDGGDCLFLRHFNQECVGIRHSTTHGTTHAWCQNRCIDLGITCEAYDFSENPQLSKTGTCRLFGSYYSARQSSGHGRYACWEKK